MNAKKPFDDSHEINFAALGQQTTEQSFNGGIFGEIYEVVNVETTGERWSRFLRGRVRRILNETRIEAWIFEGGGESDGDKDSVDFIIPVTGATTKAIKRLPQKPIFLRISVGIARRRTNDRSLFRWKNALAECVFAVALSQRPPLLNREASQKAKGILTKNRSEAVTFTPNAVFMIAKDDYPRFCAKRKEIFILFDS